MSDWNSGSPLHFCVMNSRNKWFSSSVWRTLTVTTYNMGGNAACKLIYVICKWGVASAKRASITLRIFADLLTEWFLPLRTCCLDWNLNIINIDPHVTKVHLRCRFSRFNLCSVRTPSQTNILLPISINLIFTEEWMEKSPLHFVVLRLYFWWKINDLLWILPVSWTV